MTNPYSRLLAALALTLATCGCSELDNCPEGQARKTIANVPGTTVVDELYFESAPDSGPLTPFPAKTELKFEHGLGVKPLVRQAYLSFTKDGTAHEDGGSISEVAGDQVLYECIDHKVIVIKNNTCEQDFYVKVVAMGASPSDDGKDHCN